MRVEYIPVFVLASWLWAGCGGGSTAASKDKSPDIQDTVPDTGEEAGAEDMGMGDSEVLEGTAGDVPIDAAVMGDPETLHVDIESDAGEAVGAGQDDGSLDADVFGVGDADAGDTQAVDFGPQYSETVEACIYGVEGLCEKAIKKCDEAAMNLIPDNWLGFMHAVPASQPFDNRGRLPVVGQDQHLRPEHRAHQDFGARGLEGMR